MYPFKGSLKPQGAMGERNEAIQKISQHQVVPSAFHSDHLFNQRVFGRSQIEKRLPKKMAANWIAAMEGRQEMDPEYLDHFAEALKQWAAGQGATHYCHWFQPLSGVSAQKQHSFLSWKDSSFEPIEHLSQKEFLRGEGDASSFPTGGCRSTAAGCGYTVFDPSTPPFLWKENESLILFIPSLFVSYQGEALDFKTQFLRSEQKLAKVLQRLLALANIPAEAAFPVLGPEQEYFLVDRRLSMLRPDLVLCSRTVFGDAAPKGQMMADQYYSAIDPRVLAFMDDFEDEAKMLGIPVKTRHNEVAPAQHEMAPLFEKASLASDHNLMLMELMVQRASQHNLACIFHEKPFQKINGSGKHCNWSIMTDTGINLFDPKENSFTFLVMLTAVLKAVHEHALLLRASIGSYSNDWRLGGHEAPPTILSVDLGKSLENMVYQIIHQKQIERMEQKTIDVGLQNIAPVPVAISDRNRTSFFVFNHNRFEFRAVGSSQNIAWPMTVIHAMVADSLQLILDEIEDEWSRQKIDDRFTAALPILQKHLKEAEKVIFSGDNYSMAWQEEAKRRSLPNVSKSPHAYSVLRDPKTHRIFRDVLSSDEINCRINVLYEQYAQQMDIEIQLMLELFRTQILPAALHHQKRWAKTILDLQELKVAEGEQRRALESFSENVNEAIHFIDELEKIQKQSQELKGEARAVALCDLGFPKMQKARSAVDLLERVVDDALWPLPKYRELLFLR